MRLVRALLIISASALLPHPAGASPETKIAVLPVRLLDTSAEPKDQSADHARRLQAITGHLTSDLVQTGLYQVVILTTDVVRERCPLETPECLLAAARKEDASLVLFGVVHKSSSLIMQLWARIADAQTGQVVFSRELSFRGDNDDAWRRAGKFLADQIRAKPPQGSP
jgi:hypothetical protein